MYVDVLMYGNGEALRLTGEGGCGLGLADLPVEVF